MKSAAMERSIDDGAVQSKRTVPVGRTHPDILYIMGTGRSGTTILEILLANNEGFTGIGEAKHIFRDGFLRERTCACGSVAAQCEMWSAVLRATNWQHEQWSELAHLIESVESHAHFPVTWAGLLKRKSVEKYAHAARALYDAVASASRSSVIVDSSKYPGRALLLARLFPSRVKVLCVTRSPDELFGAFAKKHTDEQKPKGVFAVALYYLYVLLCMRLVKAKLRERCFAIRFEDLTRQPENVLREIERWSGYALVTARERVATADWFDVGHIVTGNRLRKKGRVRFEPSPADSSVKPSGSLLRRVLARVLDSYRRMLGF